MKTEKRERFFEVRIHERQYGGMYQYFTFNTLKKAVKHLQGMVLGPGSQHFSKDGSNGYPYFELMHFDENGKLVTNYDIFDKLQRNAERRHEK